MARRSHKKSRNGCAECKHRHIRCDEGRPACVNCCRADRQCSFAGYDSLQIVQDPLSWKQNDGTSTASAENCSTNLLEAERTPTTRDSFDLFEVNLLHFELALNINSREFLDGSSVHNTPISEVAIKYASSAPYLAHQMLALSAMHLSITQESKRRMYRDYAASLQTRALSHFNNSPIDIDEANCVPLLLFSSLLGLHMLCDTLRFREHTLDAFIVKFTDYLNIHRGVHAISGKSWHLLQNSPLSTLLHRSADLMASSGGTNPECNALWELIRNEDLDEHARQTYRQSIEHLQRVFNVENAAPTVEEDHTMIYTWPILTSPEYIELLRKQQPEALIILAHYAVLLHRARRLWLFGGGGQFLIETIRDNLGPTWAKWLKVPSDALQLP